MGASALVSSIPGCVAHGFCESQQRPHRSCVILKSRIRVSASASSSSSQSEPDSRADADAAGENFLPSRKQANSEPSKGNAAQSALERAMAYKKMKATGAPSNPTKPSPKPSPSAPPSNPVKVEILAGKPIRSTRARAADSKLENQTEEQKVQQKEEPVALSAFERAKAYKLQQSEMISALNEEKEEATAPVIEKEEEEEENVVEIEIHTRDGIVKRRVLKPESAFANVKDIKRKGVSNLDFVGLGFADKKSSSSRPAGLSETFEAPTGPLPEVEMLIRDAGVADRDAMQTEGDDVYKPRVTTWGMFPRPADISKAYGGGRNIKPGQKLETEEERIARETKTKKLLDDYKKKLGLDMAPKDRARCERTMKEGENLMDRGQLRDAQAMFVTVMDEMPFPSELHGMAALQEAVCLDSLNRSDEAKVKYEKLVSHPNGAVRKKARQLLFGFQAAERLKVRAGYNWDSSSYRKYFDAFADGYNTMYKKPEDASVDDEDSLMQTLPYALLLIFPVILLFTLVALKNA